MMSTIQKLDRDNTRIIKIKEVNKNKYSLYIKIHGIQHSCKILYTYML